MPFAFWVMLTAVLSICGVPGFSGFFSKDQVIYGALEHGHPWLYALGILTAGITAYYMFRLLFIAFLGEYRGGVEPGAHHGAPAWIMNAPVAILVVPSVAIGAALLFGGEDSPWARFFAPLFGAQVTASPAVVTPAISEGVTSAIVFAVVVAGFAIAWQRYATRAAQADAVGRLQIESARMPAVLTNLFYVDAAIDMLFVRPAQLLGEIAGRVLDPRVIDGAVRDLVFWARWFGAVVRSFQTGLVRAYALILVFGAACFIVYYAFAGAPR
jgi:NADH-quinone oxidoreductase subunit L